MAEIVREKTWLYQGTKNGMPAANYCVRLGQWLIVDQVGNLNKLSPRRFYAGRSMACIGPGLRSLGGSHYRLVWNLVGKHGVARFGKGYPHINLFL